MLVGTIWFFAVLLILGAVTIEYYESFRARLAHSAQLILAFADANPVTENPHARLNMELEEHFDLDDYVIAVSRGGKLLYSSQPLQPYHLDELRDEHKLMLYGVAYDLRAFEDSRTDTRVVIGYQEDEPIHSVLQVVAPVVIYFIAATILIIVAVFLAVRSGLRPLDEFAAEVRNRNEENLSPLAEQGVSRELLPISTALNGLMSLLRRALDTEREFVSNAAHEMRTPLAAIQAQVEAIDGSGLSGDSRERFDNIVAAVNRCVRLIKQLLDLTRTQSLRHIEQEYETFDLVEVTQDIMAELVPAANRRQVEVSLQAPDQVRVRNQPSLLSVILRNLIENAIKYADRPGTVLVSIVPEETGEATFLVEDDGPGLSEAEFSRAMDKFQRLNRPNTEGIGLGLAIVSELSRKLDVAIERRPPLRLKGLCVALRIRWLALAEVGRTA